MIASNPAEGSRQAGGNKLRDRLIELLRADRWVNGAYPIIAPVDIEEVSRVLRGYPGPVIVVGSGTNFAPDFKPGSDVLVLLTRNLRAEFDLSRNDQVITVSSGWNIADINIELEKEGYIVPALARFNRGTVGGRLATISSRPMRGRGDGWIQSLLALEVVLPTGELLNTGSRCIKDVAGYDLRHLFTGSRGVAGILVKASFRLWSLDAIKSLRSVHSTFPPAMSPPVAGSFAGNWKLLFDPMGRMHAGA